MNSFLYPVGFSSLDQEIALDDLHVRGQIPSWLAGTLVRTGPARFEVGDRVYNHWFDGLAMLHRFEFSHGRVSYVNRYLHSEAYLDATRERQVAGEFATDPIRSLFERIAAFFFPKLSDNCNVSVDELGSDIVALTETRLPIRFDPSTLRTLGHYEHMIRGSVSTAHPHLDHARGRHYTYLLEFGRKSHYHIVSIDRAGRQAVLASIAAERPAYMHSFGMTEHLLVMAEFPFVVNPLDLRLGRKPFIQNYTWQPERGIRFHLIDKETGRLVRTIQGAPMFAFHHVNAFEDGNEVVVDIVTYPDASIIDELYLPRLRSGRPLTALGRITRFRMNQRHGNANDQPLSDAPLEFPRIDYRRLAGRRYRYVYGVGTELHGDFPDKLVRLDLEGGSSRSWYEPNCYPGEPILVTPHAVNATDQEVILSVVLNAAKPGSFLLVLDAASFQELARAEVPHAIPFLIHGNYFASSDSLRELHR